MEFVDDSDGDDENTPRNTENEPSVIDDDKLLELEKCEALVSLEDAVWSVSSAKHGNGVTCLLDNSHNTFWQSDGAIPHIIFIDFPRLTTVRTIAIYLDSKQDESYTPRKIVVHAGTHRGDMDKVAAVTVDDPKGWVMIPLTTEPEVPEPPSGSSPTASAADGDDYAEFAEDGVWCTFLRIILRKNRQNGRDCHVRGVKVLGPAHQCVYASPSFTQHLVLR